MMKKLENTLVFIPGRSFAGAATKENSIVLIAELPNNKNDEMLKVLNVLGGKSLFVPIDVADVGSVRESIETIVAKFGRFDDALNSTLGRSYSL
jgi:NAD(P)-dependent dehydrogenase (short-subunit alcohol dehydrogenase family)